MFSRHAEIIITLRTHTYTYILHEEGALKKGGRGSRVSLWCPVIFATSPPRGNSCETLSRVPAGREYASILSILKGRECHSASKLLKFSLVINFNNKGVMNKTVL